MAPTMPHARSVPTRTAAPWKAKAASLILLALGGQRSVAEAQPLEGSFGGAAAAAAPAVRGSLGAQASPVPGKIQCPPEHYRSSSIIWVCEAAAGRRFFYMKPNAAETALEIPVGVCDLRLNASTTADADLELLDSGTHAYIIRSGRKAPGSYGKMDIRFGVKAVGMANTQDIQISEITQPLLINFRSRDVNWKTVTLSFSFQFQGHCPRVPDGCTPYDEGAAWEEVKSWSSWAQSKFVNAGVAWRSLAADLSDQLGGRNLGVPWYRWGACWARWGSESSSSSWQRTFALLDIDKNEHITIDEFATGYRLSGSGEGSGMPVPLWLLWFLPFLALGCLGARYALKELPPAKAWQLLRGEGEESSSSEKALTAPLGPERGGVSKLPEASTAAAAAGTGGTAGSAVAEALPPKWRERLRGCEGNLGKMGLLECGWRRGNNGGSARQEGSGVKPQCAACGWSCRCPHCAKDMRTLPPVLAWRAPEDSEDDEILGLVQGMQAEPQNARLQEASCQRLERLALGSASKRKIAAMGGIEALIQSMQRHAGEASVQEHACGALGNLAQRSEENQQEIGQRRGVEVICRAMQAHLASTGLQERACWVTEQLAMTSQNRLEIVRCSGIERIVEAMRQHPACEAVQEHGCMALGNIAFDARTRKDIAFAGGIAAVVSAMKSFPRSPPLQENACFTLHNMACSDEAMKPISEAGGLEAVLNAMREHPAVEGVQENAINALHNVNCGPLHYVHKVLQADGLRLILRSMEAHASPSLQAKACHVLGQLGDREEAVRQEIQRVGGVRAIEAAKSTYPSSREVQQEAREALNILKEA